MKQYPAKLRFFLLMTAIATISGQMATASVILSSSASAPSPGVEDPNYLQSGGDISQYPLNQGFTDRAPGQSFTITGSGSFTLNSFSLLGGNSFGGGVETGTWAVRVSSFEGTTVTPLLTVNSIASPTLTGTDWLTWTFTGSDALTLTAGTYAVQVLANSGYYGFAGDTASPYTDGTAFNTGGNYSFGGTTVSPLDYDLTFVANVSAVPEPSSAVLLLGACATVVVSLRRRFRDVDPL